MIKFTLLFCLWTTILCSQNISGVIYDSEASVSSVIIMNVTSKVITSSDFNGNFEIFAQPHDTLTFSSPFHHTKQVVIAPLHFDAAQVFELNEIVNQLEEVDIQGKIDPKTLNEEEATATLQNQFNNDIKKNEYKYKKPNTGALDLKAIGKAIVNLLKSKTPKRHETRPSNITAEDLSAFFKKDKFLNETFLILDLNITKDYQHLLFAYCETKNLSSTLLQPNNHIYLIDKLLEHSEAFREILVASQNR